MIDVYDHRAIEVACGVVAWAVGLAISVRAVRNPSHRWAFALGTSFLVAGALDLGHGVLGVVAVEHAHAHATERMIPWTWGIGRFWLALGFARSYAAIHGWAYRHNLGLLGGLEMLSGFAALGVMLAVGLPAAYHDTFPYRWHDAVLLPVFAVLSYLYRANRVLFVSLALETAVCAAMCFSRQSFDAPFTLGHILKLASYGWMLVWTQLDSPLIASRGEAQ